MATSRTLFATCLITTIGLIGCTSETTTTTGPETSPPPPIRAAHAHPTEGPHHGELIELGNEEYHAELLHDNQSVTIYILDDAATEQVPIDAKEITINTTQDGKPEQFQLTASPNTNDPAGKSSRFVSSDMDLVSHIDEDGAEHKLALTIKGKSYRGEIAHNHDGNEGHNH